MHKTMNLRGCVMFRIVEKNLFFSCFNSYLIYLRKIVQNIEAVITAICWCLSNFILFGCLSPLVDVARSIHFGARPSFHPWPTIFHFSRYLLFHFLNNVVLFPQLVPLFSDVEIQDLKDSLGLKILCVLSIVLHVHNLKNSLKFKLLAFWKK